MSRSALIVCLLFLSLPGPSARGSGLLIPRDGSAPLRVQSHRVTAIVDDGLARTTLRQTFINHHGRALEAVYLFPLPEGAALVGLALETGSQRLEGFLAERRTARRAYNTIVRRNLDPALVEQIGRSKFRLSVFPVLPDQPTVVELTWIESVPLVGGQYRYVYPLALEGEAAQTEQDLTATVTLRSSAPIAGASTSTEGMVVRRLSPHEVRASLERSRAMLSDDIAVTARVSTPKPSLDVRVYRPVLGPTYFAAVLTPPELEEDRLIPRDVTLALDISGSMSGTKLEQAKAAGLWMLEHLRPRDRVNVILFDDTLERFAEAPVVTSPKNLEKLRRFLSSAAAGGGTALGDAIRAASEAPAEAGRSALAAILTDGLPTVGETRPEPILASARRGSERGLRLYTFGVGADVGATLLEAVALAGGGTAKLFRPSGEVESRLRTFLHRTASPAITDLKLTIDGRPVDDALPRPLPELYLGEQVVITGRHRGEGEQQVVVRGVLDGQPVELTALVDFGDPIDAAKRGETVARDLYARAKLTYLERALRLRAGLSDKAWYAALDRGTYSTEDELVAALINVSLNTGVQCPYTSFLALLPEDAARLNPHDAAALEAALQRARERRRIVAGLPPRPANSGVAEDPVAVEDPVLANASSGMDDIGVNATPLDAPFEGTVSFEPEPPRPGSNDVIGAGGGAGGGFGGKYGRRGTGRGGGRASQKQVDQAFEWLKSEQGSDGSWGGNSDAETDDDPLDPAAAVVPGDVEATSLALLAYVGAGHTMSQGPHRSRVQKAIQFLVRSQAPDGSFAANSASGSPYAHAIATLAVIETHHLGNLPILQAPGQRAIDYIQSSRRPSGAWSIGSETGGEDVLLSAWMLYALLAARDAGLDVDSDALRDGMEFVGKAADALVAEALASGSSFLDPPTGDTAESPLSVIAFSLLLRLLDGQHPDSPELRTQADLLVRHPPDATSGSIDLLYWYTGTCALWQVGGRHWKDWQEALRRAVVETRAATGSPTGPWDLPATASADGGNQVSDTAMMTLCLEVYFRYDRLFGVR